MKSYLYCYLGGIHATRTIRPKNEAEKARGKLAKEIRDNPMLSQEEKSQLLAHIQMIAHWPEGGCPIE